VRKADNLLPSCAVVIKSGNLNFLEPSGLLQACNGTDLPLPYYKKLEKDDGGKNVKEKNKYDNILVHIQRKKRIQKGDM
jgi:hypothetical protein